MPQRIGQQRRMEHFGLKLAAVRRVSLARLALTGLCWGLIGLMGFRIRVRATRHLVRPLGRRVAVPVTMPAISYEQSVRVRGIARAIDVAARHAPFRADCWPQALAAAWLCRRLAIPHAVLLGARFGGASTVRAGRLEGHAWVRSGPLTLCGGTSSGDCFGTVACFLHLPAGHGAATGDVAD